MAELLTHVLVAYALLTVASWRVEWLTGRWVVVGTGGAFIPDLSRIGLVLDAESVRALLGVPFTWNHFGTVGGVLLAAAAIAVAFDRQWWRRAYGLLVAGGLSHLVLDSMRVFADGRADQWLFPLLPAWRPPTPGLYVSSDPAVLAGALVATASVVVLDRYIGPSSRSSTE